MLIAKKICPKIFNVVFYKKSQSNPRPARALDVWISTQIALMAQRPPVLAP